MPKERMKKHIIQERGDLLDQAQKFATGDAQRIERREGEMTDVSAERLNIILEQDHEIDSIINDSGSPPSH